MCDAESGGSVMDDTDAAGSGPVATVRQFFRARNAREITSSGSAKLRDGERTEANRPESPRERRRKRLQRVYTYRGKAAWYYWEMDTLSMIA